MQRWLMLDGVFSMFGWLRRRHRLSPAHTQPVPEATRCPLNVAGPFYTLGNCLACALPEYEAPDLLARLDDHNSITYFRKQPETPDQIERGCAAIDVCCVSDLRYGGRDPAIIERLGNNPSVCDHVIRDGEVVSAMPSDDEQPED